MIATLRDDELIGERGEIIAHLAPAANAVTVRLDGFGAHEVRALIRSAALPETMPVIIDASDSLHDITGGNPYFLRELLRELDEEPTTARSATRAHARRWRRSRPLECARWSIVDCSG